VGRITRGVVGLIAAVAAVFLIVGPAPAQGPDSVQAAANAGAKSAVASTSASSDTARVASGANSGSAPTDAEADADELEEPPGYPVRLGDRELFRILVSDRARTAEERAQSGSERLLKFARSHLPVDPMTIERSTDGVDVRFAGKVAFAVFEADAAAEGRSAEQMAKERAAVLRAAILEYREARSARSLLYGALIALLATLALWAALKLLGSLARRIRGTIQTWVAAREEKIRKHTMTVLQASHVLRGLNNLVGFVRGIVTLVLLYFYLYVVFGAFPYTKSVAHRLEGMIVGPIRTIGKSFLDALPGFIFIAIIVILTRAALRLLRFLFLEIEAGRIQIQGFYSEWAKPTYNLLRVLGLFFAVVVSYPYIPGSGSEAFKGVSLFLGLLLSLGSSSAVANVVAGFVLTYMRAFRVGDVVSMAESRGVVTQVTLLATHIRTPKNEIVTLPNATVLAAKVTNYSELARESGLILHTTVTVGYDAPWRQVHALLLEAAGRTSGVKKDPAPFVLQQELQQVQIAYQLNAYTDQPERMMRTYSELHKNIQDAFNEYGVQIMTPFYEGDKSEPLVVPKDKWYAPPAKKPGEPGADQ
jgi:small-conductance mechanosensitive channel